MELKEYTKNLKNEPLLNNSRCSYYFYRFLQGTVALVVYDYERNEKISFHYPNKQKIKNEESWENSYLEYRWQESVAD